MGSACMPKLMRMLHGRAYERICLPVRPPAVVVDAAGAVAAAVVVFVRVSTHPRSTNAFNAKYTMVIHSKGNL